MSTITISLSGSAITGLTANPSKTYTVSDTDLQSLLTWATSAYAGSLPASPTNPQILQAWIQAWVDQTKHSVQNFQIPAPVVPPQISIS